MVNYTLGEGYGKLKEFEIRPTTGEICISAPLDYETRNVYEFPVVATDRGKFSRSLFQLKLITLYNNFLKYISLSIYLKKLNLA